MPAIAAQQKRQSRHHCSSRARQTGSHARSPLQATSSAGGKGQRRLPRGAPWSRQRRKTPLVFFCLRQKRMLAPRSHRHPENPARPRYAETSPRLRLAGTMRMPLKAPAWWDEAGGRRARSERNATKGFFNDASASATWTVATGRAPAHGSDERKLGGGFQQGWKVPLRRVAEVASRCRVDHCHQGNRGLSCARISCSA